MFVVLSGIENTWTYPFVKKIKFEIPMRKNKSNRLSHFHFMPIAYAKTPRHNKALIQPIYFVIHISSGIRAAEFQLINQIRLA